MDEAPYRTGYKRPPIEHRFRAGQSGNPKGRPKGARSLPEEVRALLNHTVTVTEDGRKRRINMLEAALRRLADRAISKGDLRAIRHLLTLAEQYGAAPHERAMSVDDKALLDTALRRLKEAESGDG